MKERMPQPGVELPEERAVMFEARRQRKVPPPAGRWVNDDGKTSPKVAKAWPAGQSFKAWSCCRAAFSCFV